MIDLFIPESHLHCSLKNFDWSSPKVKELVYSFIDGKTEHGFCLFGDPGIGKTHLLVAIFRELVENRDMIIGCDVQYISWSDTMTEILNTAQIAMRGGVPESVAERITQCKILISDDIRPGAGGKIWNDFIKRIIEKAYEKKTKWIISVNVESVEEIKEKWMLEDYWFSRLKNLVVFAKVKGEDRRGIK